VSDAADTSAKGLGKVLLIEDDEPTAELLESMLIEIGYRDIVRVATVEEALSVLDTTTPRMAVLDASLRGVPAHRVAAELRSRDIPFIVSTGYDPERLPGAFRSAIVLRKPFGRSQLVGALMTARRDS